jgi:hypothetical protein
LDRAAVGLAVVGDDAVGETGAKIGAFVGKYVGGPTGAPALVPRRTEHIKMKSIRGSIMNNYIKNKGCIQSIRFNIISSFSLSENTAHVNLKFFTSNLTIYALNYVACKNQL